MTHLDFAFWDALSFADSGRNPTEIFEQHIALAQQVEALGWNSYFVIEHQNTKTGVSAPSVYLTAVARATSTLRIGAMMWQLPFYHPLRLAQEVAMLDHLSQGRSNSAPASASTSTSSYAGTSTSTSAQRWAKRSWTSSRWPGLRTR